MSRCNLSARPLRGAGMWARMARNREAPDHSKTDLLKTNTIKNSIDQRLIKAATPRGKI
jgi:hypothetical protein